jgi:hypothetical protein
MSSVLYPAFDNLGVTSKAGGVNAVACWTDREAQPVSARPVHRPKDSVADAKAAKTRTNTDVGDDYVKQQRLSRILIGSAVVLSVLAVVVLSAPASAQTDRSHAGQLPPGVDDTGTVDVERVYSAHRSTLQRSGFRTSQRGSVVSTDGEIGSFDGRMTRVPNGTTLVDVESASVRDRSFSSSVWVRDNETLVRVVRDGNASTTAIPRGAESPPSSIPGSESNVVTPRTLRSHVPGQLLVVLDEFAGPYRLTSKETTVNNTLVTLRAPVTVTHERGNGTGSVRMVVDDRGVIHSARLTMQVPDRDADVTYSYELVELGVSDLQEPRWVSAGSRPDSARL